MTASRAALGLWLAAIPVMRAAADPSAQDLGEIVITADRVPEPIGLSGSSITVLPSELIEKYADRGVADVLRGVAGVDVVETGGAGQATSVSLRGAGAQRTLVLIDGVPCGDPSGVDSSLNFGNLLPVEIERIEVLRGPQSALYGSDAMGGVINIISKKGRKGLRRSVTVEGGSYGTLETRGSLSGGDDRWTYSLGVNLLHTDGFPRFGYRIDRPIPLSFGPLPPLPAKDPTDKAGLAGQFSYKLSNAVTIDAAVNLYGNANRFDNPFASIPSNVFNTYNHQLSLVADGFVKATIDPWNGFWKHQLTVFGNVTDNTFKETESCFNAAFVAFDCLNGYRGARYGAEYQGDVNLGPYGGLTYGAQTLTESASTREDPNPNDGSFTPISAQQTTVSGFGEYRYTAFNHLDLTLGGRVDSVLDGPTFGTWRATAAYRFDTGTKIRASAGTGAKTPTLYERFSPYGTPGLLPETNFAYDIGIDQKIFNDRATLSASYFWSSYKNLINFAEVSGCSAVALATGGGCYYNIGTARIQGVEVSADATLVPNILRVNASYTYTDARDLDSSSTDLFGGSQLARVPFNKGSLSLTWDPTPQWEIEPRLTVFDSRLDTNFLVFPDEKVTLAPYAKLDVYARYKFNDNVTMFARAENLTDTRYEETYDYGTAGRSIYGGMTINW